MRLAPNPVIAARFVQQLNVPVTTIGLGADLVSRFTQREVLVAVYVPRGGAPIRSDDVRAVLHLEGHGPGVYNVPVEVIAPRLEIKSLSPASLTLAIERIEERSIAVALRYAGSKNVVVKTISVQPRNVSLRAPTGDLSRVASVRIEVPLPNTPSNLDAMVRPIAMDASGVEVPTVSVSPNLLRVRAQFVAAQRPRP